MWCPNFRSYFLWTIFILLLLLHICVTFKYANVGKTLFSLERWQTLFTLPWNYTVDWVEKSQTLFTLACSPVVATTLFSWTYCPDVDTFYKWKCTVEKSQTVSTHSWTHSGEKMADCLTTTLFSWTYCPVDTFYKWKCTMEKSQTFSTHSWTHLKPHSGEKMANCLNILLTTSLPSQFSAKWPSDDAP